MNFVFSTKQRVFLCVGKGDLTLTNCVSPNTDLPNNLHLHDVTMGTIEAHRDVV